MQLLWIYAPTLLLLLSLQTFSHLILKHSQGRLIIGKMNAINEFSIFLSKHGRWLLRKVNKRPALLYEKLHRSSVIVLLLYNCAICRYENIKSVSNLIEIRVPLSCAFSDPEQHQCWKELYYHFPSAYRLDHAFYRRRQQKEECLNGKIIYKSESKTKLCWNFIFFSVEAILAA